MGVKDLWSLLSPTCERKSLYELQGKAVAVDLSGWVVEDQSLAVHSTQPRMYLRNLFFRTSCLLMLGAQPIFVLEGVAPAIKHDTIARRNKATQASQGRCYTQASQGRCITQASQFDRNKGNRSRLKSLLKQCEEMLRVMGVACVQSSGEAEALCAQLDSEGIVDGCITQDGDCFLYGARTVYRNFTISPGGGSSSSGYSVDVYTMANIEAKLGLTRERLVALSVLCGCDYGPGVSGVGKQMAVAFLDSLQRGEEALQRLQRWRTDPYFEHLEREREVLTSSGVCDRCCHGGRQARHDAKGCEECGSKAGCRDNLSHRVLTHKEPDERKAMIAELNLRRKALVDPAFPSREMIEEFLLERPEPRLPELNWSEPDLEKFVKFADRLLAWTPTYAVEKLLPLATRWHLTLLHGRGPGAAALSPYQIVKKRVQKGVACYELRWSDNRGLLDTLELDEGVTPQDLLISVEPQTLVERFDPELVQAFEAEREQKKKKSKKAPRKATATTSDSLRQTSMNRFLLPPASGDPADVDAAAADLSRLAIGPRSGPQSGRVRSANCKAAAVKKKPHVTVASLVRTVGAIEACKAVGRGNTMKRVASPRLKVGLKTRKVVNSTPQKFTPKKSWSAMCVSSLEESFRNISLVDDEDYDDDDDGDFSDLSAIIDGIVGTDEVSRSSTAYHVHNKRLSQSKQNKSSAQFTGLKSKDVCDDDRRLSGAEDRVVKFDLGLSDLVKRDLMQSDLMQSDLMLGDLMKRDLIKKDLIKGASIGNDATRDEDKPALKTEDLESGSESDEFDFCNRQVVPLMDRLASLL